MRQNDFSDNIRSKEALHLPHVEPRAMVEGIEKPQVDRYNAIWRKRESAGRFILRLWRVNEWEEVGVPEQAAPHFDRLGVLVEDS